MKKKKKSGWPRDVVHISGFNSDGESVFEQSIDYIEYYEELHPIIDDEEFRSQRSIRRITGRIFNHAGELEQQFTIECDVNGKTVRTRIVFADGTVSED